MKNKSEHSSTGTRPLFIATWHFGKQVNEAALAAYQQTQSMLDAIEQGIWQAEADPENDSVGRGGIPNSEGVVQLDACIMSGPGHRAGAVCALESILHPISVARKIMEHTPHVMLAGEGARQFAIENGFVPVNLLTDQQKEKWQQRYGTSKQVGNSAGGKPAEQQQNHDTVTLLGIDQNHDLYGGCSTSGWGYKLPGRVGDSPIIGSGLYVDNEVGAVGATGTGENVMRYCASLQIVEAMRGGSSPQQAIELIIQRLIARETIPPDKLKINFIALDKQGRYGAAGTSRGFQYALATPGNSLLFDAKSITDSKIATGGNKEGV
jgi:N4-(beta-N-acetylglucosaminyl)-L-asparaginase